MTYARLFTDDNGESRFDDVEIQFDLADYVQSAAPLELSAMLLADEFRFLRAPAGWTSDFHASSARNFFVVLNGEWEVTASNGESRRFAVGSVLIVEDTHGKGHASRVVSPTASVAVMVQLK